MPCSRTQHGDACGVRTQDLEIRSPTLLRSWVRTPQASPCCVLEQGTSTPYTAETQSGLPLLPWSCYASVIQCDIIQYLWFLFYDNTGIISFLAIYNDTILCTIFCVSERLYAKKTLFLTCYDVALLFWVFCKHVCFNVHE